jgi:hypothetical protein
LLSKQPEFFAVRELKTPQQRRGRNYEKWVGERLRHYFDGARRHPLLQDVAPGDIHVIHNQWFQYELLDGKASFAECDYAILVEQLKLAIIVECKLTMRRDAVGQLERLYMPLMKLARQDLKVFGIIIANNLTAQANPKKVVTMFDEFLDFVSLSQRDMLSRTLMFNSQRGIGL